MPVNIIILKSEVIRLFVRVLSFDELVAVSTLEEGKIFFNGFAKVINAHAKRKKVIIGRVQGKSRRRWCWINLCL